MPKFLAGWHYNEEEISRHLKKGKKKNRILAGPNEWQQVCNRPNPEEKPVEVVEGRILACWSSKVSRNPEQQHHSSSW
jgi:hypothetical protein